MPSVRSTPIKGIGLTRSQYIPIAPAVMKPRCSILSRIMCYLVFKTKLAGSCSPLAQEHALSAQLLA